MDFWEIIEKYRLFFEFRKKSVKKIKYSVETNRNIFPDVKKLQSHTDFFRFYKIICKICKIKEQEQLKIMGTYRFF